MAFDAEQAFEQFSHDYLKIREAEYSNEEQVSTLGKKLFPIKNKKILELGCGGGKPVLEYFYQQGADIVGVDISANMIDVAKNNLTQGKFIHADMLNVILEKNHYDAILSFYALFVVSIADQYKMFEKIYQALKPGGITYFTLLCEAYTKQKEFEGMLAFLGHELFFAQTTPEKYRQKLEAIGFKNITMNELQIGSDETCLWVYAEKI